VRSVKVSHAVGCRSCQTLGASTRQRGTPCSTSSAKVGVCAVRSAIESRAFLVQAAPASAEVVVSQVVLRQSLGTWSTLINTRYWARNLPLSGRHRRSREASAPSAARQSRINTRTIRMRSSSQLRHLMIRRGFLLLAKSGTLKGFHGLRRTQHFRSFRRRASEPNAGA
jgi:hypothetical protein